ncbi:hypothetical protein L7F22_059798 [Adiantum nelumboides]|nr:hypothetical protein [Adiantum nelumboides]
MEDKLTGNVKENKKIVDTSMNAILIRLSKMEKDMETWQKEKEEWEKGRTKWEEEKIAMQAQMETMKGFVQDCSLLDNVVTFYEAVEWALQTGQPTAIILLDFEKAYDRVDWGFLEGTLHWMGFPDVWIRGISALYRSSSAAVTIGGHVGRTFALSRSVSGLDEALSELSIIHVAGTKGKGSTCTFSESILGECGYKTGLFTSPHLIDVRERFKINRANVSEQVFLKHFWWCWDKFKINVGSDMPMPTYFRFLTLLAFKIFIEEKVDVAILEVGLGGRFDATNVVRTPTVCGITSLGFDHMEILGYTLPEIAGEKAGIFKPGIPAFTVTQQKEAMNVLQNKASELDIRLQVVSPLTKVLLNGSQLSMEGEHQLSNGALAVALCHCWAQRREDKKHLDILAQAMSKGHLPEPYIRGLISAQLLGRAQQIDDPFVKGLSFFLDGAHSPESMEVCGRWFCLAAQKANCIKERELQETDLSNEELDVHFVNAGGFSKSKIQSVDQTSKRVYY